MSGRTCCCSLRSKISRGELSNASHPRRESLPFLPKGWDQKKRPLHYFPLLPLTKNSSWLSFCCPYIYMCVCTIIIYILCAAAVVRIYFLLVAIYVWQNKSLLPLLLLLLLYLSTFKSSGLAPEGSRPSAAPIQQHHHHSLFVLKEGSSIIYLPSTGVFFGSVPLIKKER